MPETLPESPQLKRSLSLTLVTFYGVGTILGAGIYVLVGKVAGYAGMYTPIAFVLASLLAAFSAFSYAELSARFPKSAGEAVYVQEGLGWRHLSIVVGLLIVLIGTISTATLIHGFVGYFKIFVALPDTLVIIGLVVIMAAVVIWGISESVFIASVMTVVEIGGLVLILWVGREGLVQLPTNAVAMIPSLDLTVWYGILLGSFIAFYAFIGFEDIVNVAEEVVDPHRNLPRAIIIALVVTSIFYLLVAITAVSILPPAQLAQSDAPLALVYQYVTGKTPVIITLISLLSVLNGAMIQIIMASRVLYGMSRQGWLPPLFGNVNAFTRTPVLATLIIASLILLFALTLPLLSLAKLTSFITLSVFALINLSLWRVKVRAPVPEDIRTVPILVPVLGFLFSTAFVVFQLFYWLGEV